MHPQSGALPLSYAPARVTRGALVAHMHLFLPPLCRTSLYLLSWILGVAFEAAKTAPFLSRGLHHLVKFLELSDELAGRGCCCFLMW